MYCEYQKYSIPYIPYINNYCILCIIGKTGFISNKEGLNAQYRYPHKQNSHRTGVDEKAYIFSLVHQAGASLGEPYKTIHGGCRHLSHEHDAATIATVLLHDTV